MAEQPFRAQSNMSTLGVKPLANMYFNQHGGRRGTRSASSWSQKALRDMANDEKTIRPNAGGLLSPHKPTQLPSGHEGNMAYSHIHQLHENYNEKQ